MEFEFLNRPKISPNHHRLDEFVFLHICVEWPLNGFDDLFNIVHDPPPSHIATFDCKIVQNGIFRWQPLYMDKILLGCSIFRGDLKGNVCNKSFFERNISWATTSLMYKNIEQPC